MILLEGVVRSEGFSSDCDRGFIIAFNQRCRVLPGQWNAHPLQTRDRLPSVGDADFLMSSQSRPMVKSYSFDNSRIFQQRSLRTKTPALPALAGLNRNIKLQNYVALVILRLNALIASIVALPFSFQSRWKWADIRYQKDFVGEIPVFKSDEMGVEHLFLCRAPPTPLLRRFAPIPHQRDTVSCYFQHRETRTLWVG